MKILYALETVNLAAGFDRVIIEKVNYLSEHGYDVVLTVTSHILSKPYFPISDKVKLIDMGVDFHKQYKHGLFLRAVVYLSLMRNYRKAMSALLFSEKPDIVITSLGREMDFLTDIKDGSVKIGESHIAKDYARNLHLMEKKGFLYRMIARYRRNKLDWGVRKLDSLLLLTQHDADSWAGLTKTHVIPNSIPFYPSQTSTCENKKVIFVGRLNEQKGLEYLIESWKGVCARFKDWELHIYGGGEQEKLLHQLIAEAGVGGSVIVHAPTQQIMEKYLESSICILTSRFEGFGMVLIEAMACGVPVVSFDCPWGPADIIKDGEDGFLVEYLNTDEASRRVCQLIESSDLRKKMGAKARINVKRYDRDVIMKQWMDLFDQVKH